VDCEFPNPVDSESRLKNWPTGHDIGVYLSLDDGLTLVGTAAGHSGLYSLLQQLADEWQEKGWALDDVSWFFEPTGT
jgi:hypothetical protein